MLKTTCKVLFIPVVVPILLSFSVKAGIACRMYGVLSDNLPDDLLAKHLIRDPHALSKLSSLHTDGWGITYYPTYGDKPTIERGAIRAWNDPVYTTVVNQINLSGPTITLAHIRLCSSGCCDHNGDSIADPHPFYRTRNGKTWTFIHNGGVDYNRLYALVGDEYLNANGPYGSGVPNCITSNPYDPPVVDSELYFLHILKKIEENDWDVVTGIVEAVRELINDGETGGMIFLLSDGTTLWAFLRGSIPSYHTLYYEYNAKEGYAAVASEYPSNSQESWQPINNNELVVFRGNEAPTVIDVTTFTATTIPSQPCIAEIIYREDLEVLALLNYLRNTILMYTPEGQEIIKLYSGWSPVVVHTMEQDEVFKEKVKTMIDYMLPMIELVVQ